MGQNTPNNPITVVDIPDLGIDIKDTRSLKEYLKERYANAEVEIKSDGKLVLINRGGRESVLKRKNEHRKTFSALDRIIEESHYIEYFNVDNRHAVKRPDLKGQFVYCSMINLGGEKYVATIKLDDSDKDTKAHFKDVAIKKWSLYIGRTDNPDVDLSADHDINIPQFIENVKSFRRKNNLKNWFGDSKVVDENGEPLIVYHGTNADFNVFDTEKFGAWDNGSKFKINGVDEKGKLIFETIKDEGFFFSSQKQDAEAHADGAVEIAGGSPRVISAYLKAERPLVVEIDNFYAEVKQYDTQDWYDHNTTDILEEFHAGDYDSVIIKNPVNKKDSMYIVFSPNQIKSATDNIGTFDLNNPDIYKQSNKNGEKYRGGYLAPSTFIYLHCQQKKNSTAASTE